MNDMKNCFDKFCSRMRHVEDVLKGAKREVLAQEAEILGILERGGQKLLAITKEKQSEESPEMQSIANELLSSWGRGIAQWKQTVADSSKIRAELEKYGSGLIIAVFGRTNAGKSTLGNFIRGKTLLEAPFANAWKDGNFKASEIRVIEQGADSEVEIGEPWLREGAVETTREAQLFTLPGILWLDTPGFGSVNEQLGDLARRYVQRADIIVSLDHSDNPGLRSHSGELVPLLENGRVTLVVINHSDSHEKIRGPNGRFMYGEDGNVVRDYIGKSKATRIDQEKQVIQTLRDLGFKGNCDAMSISMLLAKKGVMENDEEKFSQGNFSGLLERICNIVKSDDDIKSLKFKEGRTSLIALINTIIGPSEQHAGGISLEIIISSLRDSIDRIHKLAQDFMPEREAVAISTHINMRARTYLINKF